MYSKRVVHFFLYFFMINKDKAIHIANTRQTNYIYPSKNDVYICGLKQKKKNFGVSIKAHVNM